MLRNRSINIFILDKFLVYPLPPVMASPNSSVHEATGNRSPRDNDRPEMPNFRPSRVRLQRPIKVIPTGIEHARPQGLQAEYDRLTVLSAFTLRIFGNVRCENDSAQRTGSATKVAG
jgi:hypothetical protein